MGWTRLQFPGWALAFKVGFENGFKTQSQCMYNLGIGLLGDYKLNVNARIQNRFIGVPKSLAISLFFCIRSV